MNPDTTNAKFLVEWILFRIAIRLLSIGGYVFGLYEQLCCGAILDELPGSEFEMQLVAAEPLSKHKTGQTLPPSKPLSCPQ